jgi:hypothetical protein
LHREEAVSGRLRVRVTHVVVFTNVAIVDAMLLVLLPLRMASAAAEHSRWRAGRVASGMHHRLQERHRAAPSMMGRWDIVVR